MLTLGLITAASVTLETMKTMWKIEIRVNSKDATKRRLLTTSKYPTEKEAKAAAEQLRLVSYGYKGGVPMHEKEKAGKFKMFNYTVTDPIQC